MSRGPFDAAACRGHHDLYFAARDETPVQKARRISRAMDLCATCPALAPCRDIGRSRRELGIWGGETEAERALAGFVPSHSTDREVARAKTQRAVAHRREVDRHRNQRRFRSALEGRAS